MSDSSSTTSRKTWTDRAAQYAEEQEWQLVPLQANSKSSPLYSDDPVERQLGCLIPVEYPGEATSDPEEIRSLGVQFPVALVGAVTGAASNLLAVEINRSEASSDLLDRLDTLSSGAPRVLGTHREYVLFQYPQTEQSLPPLTETEGAVLHGEGSVVRLPWRYYRWSLDSRDTPEPPTEELLSLFDLVDTERNETDLQTAEPDPPPSGDTPVPDAGDPHEAETADAELDGGQLDLPLEAHPSNGQTTAPNSRSLFRSGAALQEDRDVSSERGLPWTIVGGLSLLAGRPKTAGKSTWTVNLAAHLAAGHSFLGAPSRTSDVVFLADTAPAVFRETLRRLSFLDADDLAHLHVLHPRDVQDLDWRTTLQRAYDHAEAVDAGLLVIDCLDRYVRLKGGERPTSGEELAHALTAEAPSDCAVLAVKSTDCTAREPLAQTLSRLDLLGLAADIVLRLDNVSTASFPSLRRLQTVSRTGTTPSTVYCALRRGRYERVQGAEPAGGPSQEPAARHRPYVSGEDDGSAQPRLGSGDDPDENRPRR